MVAHSDEKGESAPGGLVASPEIPARAASGPDIDALRTTLSLTSARIAYFDNDNRIRYATPAFARSVGAEPDQVAGRTLEELHVPPQAIAQQTRLRDLVDSTGKTEHEHISVSYKGFERDTEMDLSPVPAPDGGHQGAVVTLWDVTTLSVALRRVAQLDRIHSILSDINQAIIRTKERDAIFQETCRIAAETGGFELAWIGLLQPDGTVLVAARAGRDVDVLDGVRITALDEPEGRGIVGTAIRERRSVVVDNTKFDERMTPWRTHLIGRRFLTAAGFPLTTGGEVIGALALYSSMPGYFNADEVQLFEELASDLSYALDSLEAERRRVDAEAALRDSERRYRDLFEKNPNAMWVYDFETFGILAVNDAAVHMYGYTREEFAGLTLLDIRPPEDIPAFIENVRASGGQFSPRGTWRHIRKDRQVIDVEITGHDVDFNGRHGRLVLITDVTDRRRLEAQLAEATRMEAMGHLAGGIAHDFNNLLTAVNGYAELLIAELGDGPLADDAKEIRRAGLRAAELTRQVLAFARRQVLAPRPVDVNVVVTGIAQMLTRLLGEQVKLTTSLLKEPAVVIADPGQLEQVLVNLAINSRDAMPGGGALAIRVEIIDDGRLIGRSTEGPSVLIRVTDTGVGMSPEVLAHAFEPFYTTKQAGSGTGLGLATVHGIVHQSNGEVWAESEPGRGTTVNVLFRRAKGAPELPDAPAAAPGQTAVPATVLVVEDEPAVRGFVVSTLERAGYRVLVAGSPAEAVALTEGLDTTIDVLVTDLIMPETNGQVLAERLVAHRPNMRVILMSGYGAGLEAGPDAGFRFLAKPFGRDEIVEAVAAAVAEAEAEAEREIAR